MVKHVGYLVTTVVVSLALVLMPVTSVVHAQGFLDELRDAGESLDKLRGAAESMQELGKTLGNLTGATDGQPAQEDRLNPATNQPHNETEHTGHVRTQREWGEIQARLNELGYNAGPVDGIPGRGTRRAIAAFESANALDRDGHVDPLMLQVLFSHDAQAMPEVVSRPSRTFTSDSGSETVSRPETAIIDATRTGGSPGSTAKLCENFGFAAGKEGSKFTRLTDALHDKIGTDFEQAKRYFADKPGYRLLFHPLLKTSIRGDSENLFEKEWQAARIDLEVCFISRYIAYWLVYLSLEPERITEDVAIGFSNRILRTVGTYVDGVIEGARLDKGYPAPDVLDAYERFFQRFVKTSIYVPYYGHTRLSLRTGGHSDLIIRSTQIIRNAPRYDYTEIPGLASRVLEGRATLLGEAMSIEVEGRPEEILSAEYVAWIAHIDKTYANYSQEEQIATLLSQSTIQTGPGN